MNKCNALKWLVENVKVWPTEFVECNEPNPWLWRINDSDNLVLMSKNVIITKQNWIDVQPHGDSESVFLDKPKTIDSIAQDLGVTMEQVHMLADSVMLGIYEKEIDRAKGGPIPSGKSSNGNEGKEVFKPLTGGKVKISEPYFIGESSPEFRPAINPDITYPKQSGALGKTMEDAMKGFNEKLDKQLDCKMDIGEYVITDIPCDHNMLKGRSKKIYISGPMTGYDDFNRPAFNVVAEKVKADGNAPLNPALAPDGLTQAEYMQLAMQQVFMADAIIMLDGWHQSKGARAEYALAEKLGLLIIGSSE